MLTRWITTAYLVLSGGADRAAFRRILWRSVAQHAAADGRYFKWYATVAADPSFRRAFFASLFVAVMTCIACVAIGLPLAYAVFRARSPRVRALARVLYQLPVALPALVLAFGFILVFSSDTLPWLGSVWLLIAGHIVLGLPYFLQTVVSDMQRLGLRVLEEAAESLGSNGLQRFLHIVLPALRHSVLSGLIIVAALSIGEFQFSNLISGFLNRTYPVVLLQAFYGATGFACAATVILLALALTASVTGALSARGAGRLPILRCHAHERELRRSVSSNATFRYPGGKAGIFDATLDIAPGELVVCIGPSGCGKTTLLKLIAGFLRLDSGRVYLGGEDVTAATVALARVRHRVPVLCVVSAHDRLGERRLPAARSQCSARGAAAARRGDAGDGRPLRMPRSAAGGAFRRPTAARRAGAGAGVQAARTAARRTALRTRCRDAGDDAR